MGQKNFFLNCLDEYPFSENNTGYIKMDKIESIDIDTDDDLKIAESILNLKK